MGIEEPSEFKSDLMTFFSLLSLFLPSDALPSSPDNQVGGGERGRRCSTSRRRPFYICPLSPSYILSVCATLRALRPTLCYFCFWAWSGGCEDFRVSLSCAVAGLGLVVVGWRLWLAGLVGWLVGRWKIEVLVLVWALVCGRMGELST
ncbi:hypothetical protein K505DRAFT_145268 [Melanomma pulvis-pyrius CBS 109.77]|uniref:Uncharacterized protein n=1 Tax=Melanomma pulvis-pyrius CBS 109.77 TaxID=1314802 RepID=A0A6A6WR68_9PLEO|nr:hypothetical protein K505DRAFT_145268 [Melanomma pulvis-pyrius CBS 109.77]